jgi:hypothetical protein
MKKIFLLLTLFLASFGLYADVSVPLFSALKPDQPLPKSFNFISLPKIKHNAVTLVDDAVDNRHTTVLKVESDNSAGSIGIPLTATREAGNTTLEWRWKVNRKLEKADMSKKTGDDFAGRVYVFFDVPLDSLSFMERSKIRLARAVAGADVPTAALCYVWDNTHAVGHTQWSPYTNRVRKIVLQTGGANINKWVKEPRDVAADFKVAFGFDAPAITGVAVGNDTDNTDDNVTTWFGDVKFIKPL